jgi:hypothetical protein
MGERPALAARSPEDCDTSRRHRRRADRHDNEPAPDAEERPSNGSEHQQRHNDRDRAPKHQPREHEVILGHSQGVFVNAGADERLRVCVDSTQTRLRRCELHFVLSQH